VHFENGTKARGQRKGVDLGRYAPPQQIADGAERA